MTDHVTNNALSAVSLPSAVHNSSSCVSATTTETSGCISGYYNDPRVGEHRAMLLCGSWGEFLIDPAMPERSSSRTVCALKYECRIQNPIPKKTICESLNYRLLCPSHAQFDIASMIARNVTTVNDQVPHIHPLCSLVVVPDQGATYLSWKKNILK